MGRPLLRSLPGMGSTCPHREGVLDVPAGQAIVTRAGEWVQYSTPGAEGAEYIAVCLPAFSPQTVHRDP